MYSSVEKPPPQREVFRQSECTAVLLLFFMPKFIAHGGVSLYIITCVLTHVMNGAILSKLELQKKPRKPHENG